MRNQEILNKELFKAVQAFSKNWEVTKRMDYPELFICKKHNKPLKREHTMFVCQDCFEEDLLALQGKLIQLEKP